VRRSPQCYLEPPLLFLLIFVARSLDKRGKFSRKRANDDEGDITYINERNKVFNKKVSFPNFLPLPTRPPSWHLADLPPADCALLRQVSLVPTRVVALIPALDSEACERSSWAGALERLVTFVPTTGTKPAEVSPGAGGRDPVGVVGIGGDASATLPPSSAVLAAALAYSTPPAPPRSCIIPPPLPPPT
jgi:hypothetical protein